MANNIYRRQPIVRKLPSGYSGLEALGYINLNNIKGLQIYDNLLLAEQNATYSCKNVYTDELGNLTVRPRLLYSVARPNVEWYYQYGDNALFKVDSTLYSFIVQQAYRTLSIDSDSEIAVEEYFNQELNKNVPYIFVRQNGVLKVFEVSDTGFTEVTGDIQIVDEKQPDISSYNILNRYVYHRTYKLNDERPANRYGLENRVYLPRRGNPNIVEYFTFNNHIFIGLGRGSSISGYFININDFSIIPIGEYFTVEKSETGVIVSARRKDASNTIDVYDIDVTGAKTLIDTYTINGTSTILYGVDSKNYISRYDNAWYYNGTQVAQFEEVLGVTDIYSVQVIGRSDGVVAVQYNTDAQTTVPNIYLIAYSPDYVELIDTITLVSNDFVIASNRHGIAMYDGTTLHYILASEKVYYNVSLSTVIDALPTVSQVTGQFSLSDTNLNIAFNNTTYNISLIDITKVLTYLNTINLAIFDDGKFRLNIRDANGYELLQYNILFEDIQVERPVDDIPVLSEIDDKILTSFYLDGIYWFVTEHHIFGTGAANGKMSITFFDPKKYFAFSEKLTSVSRVSDTSFWVFHNSGAYLIYKTASTDDNGYTVYNWLVTNTAKSKGCDFKNSSIVLPVTNYVAVVTTDDICQVQMRQNIQSDERLLVPLTLKLEALVRELLNQTESIKIATYRYLTIFFLNTVETSNITPALCYNAATEDWWYWEFPVTKVLQVTQTETNVELLCKVGLNGQYINNVYNLDTELFVHKVGTIDYTVYADKLDTSTNLWQIEWSWESVIQYFKSVDYRKQLLFTTFVLGEYNNRLADGNMANDTVSFQYEFEIYANKYSEKSLQSTSVTVERAKNNQVRTSIGSFTYLQMILRNQPYEPDTFEFDTLSKPQISCISFKYRVLPGGII
ncbi:MAG: hypothetical protein IKU15_00325 [Clostridia bacterium]|nr:hypothetical protein [Clostridia bacterium]MBR4889747.1 hypothetical protein [Clostridia bacterium]